MIIVSLGHRLLYVILQPIALLKGMPVQIGCQKMVRSGKQCLSRKQNIAQLLQHEFQKVDRIVEAEVYFRASRGVL